MSTSLLKRFLASLLLVTWQAGTASAAAPPPVHTPAEIILGDPPLAPKVRAAPSSALAAPSSALTAQALATAGFAVDTQDREAVRVFYRGAFFLSEDVPIGWTGNFATGDAGTTGQAFRDAVALRLNWYRALAGVPANLSLLDLYNLKDQQAALMMSANGQLSHAPPPSWIYYTAAGAEAAASSNLSLGNNGPRAIASQMRDAGSNNPEVGHRRWVLYPQTRTMGTGDVPAGVLNGVGVSPANALWVFDGNFGGTRPATRDGFVAWPPRGYVPYPVVYGRWSLSYPNADFSSATVTVSKGGVGVPVLVEYRSTATTPNFGEDTIVWSINGSNDAAVYPRPNADENHLVTVSGVRGTGVPSSFSYNVIVFDPDVMTAGAPLTTASAPATVASAAPFTGSVAAMPGATGYQLNLYRPATLSGALTPGNSAVSWSQLTSGYNAIEATEFHLYHAAFETQQLTLGDALYVGQNASLSFERRFSFATPTEVARVQVSLDGGIAWQDIHAEAGTSGTVPYATVNVSLSAFAGRMIRLRYSFTLSGSFFNCSTCGWYFRNITFNNVSRLTPASQATLSAALPSTSLVAADPGNYILLGRTEYQGSYFGDWGPGFAITATPATAPVLTAPTAVSASAGIGSIIVRFSAPANSSGAAITGYTATCTSSDGGIAGSNTGTASATSITVAPLSDGKRYTCTVRANNAAGPGPASAASNPVTPLNFLPLLNLLLND